MEIQILRLGHRLPRDERISTHVALVARTFGASGIVYTGQHDSGLEDSVKRICANWGGKTGNEEKEGYGITYEKNYSKPIKKAKEDGFTIVHLTMYGMPLLEKIGEIKKMTNDAGRNGKLLVVIGSEHVPGEVYQLADFNVAVTNQPHSEVAALAITLNELNNGEMLKRDADVKFKGKIRVKPNEKGKSFY
ncbi:MAG: tRNA (cytidine(56)-2'-O)-methyltransferase [Candidatus Micrarchaeia archaeon]